MIREGIWSIKNFSSEALKKYDLFWIGEIHGIRENYKAYKTILPYLAKNGFRNILWEMPSDFSGKSEYTEDARINPFSIKFLKWLNEQINIGNIDNLTFFGETTPEDYGGIIPEDIHSRTIVRENRMAEEVIDKSRNTKSVVITGNYHIMNLASKGRGEKSAADFIKEKSNLKILKIYLDYSGGTFYNYGYKTLIKKNSYKESNLEFGTISRHGDKFFFHVGRVNAVFKSPEIKTTK